MACLQQDKEESPRSLPRLRTGPMRILGRPQSEAKQWDARQWLRETTGRQPPRSGQRPAIGALPVQLLVCVAIVAVVLVVRALDVPRSAEVFASINDAITTDSDLDRAIGKLKFVGSFFGESKPVFNPETQGLVPPIKDLTIETGGAAQTMLTIAVPDEITPVLAAADGQIFYAGSSNEYGSLVRIRHEEGYETLYGGIHYEVQTGDTVLAGERIGYIKGGELRFAVYHDGRAIDARAYLKKTEP